MVDEGSELCYVVRMVLRLVEKELEVMAGLLGEEDEWERSWKGRKGRGRVVEGVKVLVNVVRLFNSSEKREKCRWGKMEDLAKRGTAFLRFSSTTALVGLLRPSRLLRKAHRIPWYVVPLLPTRDILASIPPTRPLSLLYLLLHVSRSAGQGRDRTVRGSAASDTSNQSSRSCWRY